jgi:hypothetical protein
MQVETPDFVLEQKPIESTSSAADSGLSPAAIAQIYSQVFRRLKPRTPLPQVHVEFRKYANANAHIKLENSVLEIRLADTLGGAPEDVVEALAEILLAKLFRRPIPRWSNHRYRRYLNGREVRQNLNLVRQIRGRKRIGHPQGQHYDLDGMFDDLNLRYFFGLMAKPKLGWSPQASRTMLGHYDPSHNAIVLSRILDRSAMPQVVVEYVLFHEMLHLRYPAEHKGARRRVHTKEFKQAERQFEQLELVKSLLKKLL